MEPFKKHRGIVAIIDRANIDTDAIIPKQFLKEITRTGFGDKLFFDWRYLPDGTPDPEFVLNKDYFRNATVLVARNNFGCGSSREHAVWAIMQHGVPVVIAPRKLHKKVATPAFADIFRNNSVKNGLLAVELSSEEVEQIFQFITSNPGAEITVDLEKQEVIMHGEQDLIFNFEIDKGQKEYLMRGLDDIALTLENLSDIEAFEANHNSFSNCFEGLKP